MPRPGTTAPALNVELIDGSMFDLADARPARFTMIVFFRGYFCGVCKSYLPELQRNEAEFARHGVDIVLASSDNAERSTQIRDEWDVSIPIGHSLDHVTGQAWDLYFTEGDPARPEMPKVFTEPGLFLITPEHEIFFSATCTAPVGRPQIAELVGWFEFMEAKNAYPMRGTYVP
jgi:peroxiredoxin